MSDKPDQSEKTKVCLSCGMKAGGAERVCPADGSLLVHETADPLLGTTLDSRYEIESVIGEGGMGIVYRAKHGLMGRDVAVKTLHSHMASDPNLLKRFQQEAQAISALDHPHVVSVHDFGMTPQGHPYLVLSYLSGRSLEDVLREEKRLDWHRALAIFLQVCEALGHAHSKGVIHRDIKPGNIMLTQGESGPEHVKVFDFGIAKMADRDKESHNLTATGQVFGSVNYMSPEQCTAKPLDARSDIYSFGCVMYEVLVGHPPFSGEGALEIVGKHIAAPAPAISAVAPDIGLPAQLEEAVMSALAKDPGARPQSMGALKVKLLASARPSLANLVPALAEPRRESASESKRESAAEPRHENAAELLQKTTEYPAAGSKKGKIALAAGLVVLVAVIAWAYMFGTTISGKGGPSGDLEQYWKETERAVAEGQYELAELKGKLAISAGEKLGAPDPRLAKTLIALGVARRELGDLKGADAVLSRALSQAESLHDEGDLMSSASAAMAKLYLAKGSFSEAESMIKRTIKTDEKSHGRKSEPVADDLNIYGQVLRQAGKFDAARDAYLEALNTFKEVSGETSQGEGHVLNNLALVYGSQGNHKKAVEMCRKSLAVLEKVLGPDNSEVGSVADNLAEYSLMDGDYKTAETMSRRALSIAAASSGEESQDYADALAHLAAAYAGQGKYDNAEPLYKQSIATAEKLLGKDDPGYRRKVHSYASMLLKMGRNRQARQLLQGQAM